MIHLDRLREPSRLGAAGFAVFAACLLVFSFSTPALADGHEEGDEAKSEETDEERIERLEETVDVLADELDSLAKSIVVPEDQELKSIYGLGPAASKVYQRERGLSIGGYGEVLFRGQVDDETPGNDLFDALRGVLYVGYKFNDWIVFNSEIEFEHAGTSGGGSASLEFMTLDFLLHEYANVRAGLLLIPMGFVNEIHEPVFFFGAQRPEVERRIIPSTFRENGAGIFGGNDWISYRFYAVNGLKASGFDDNGLRGGRQKGSEAMADHWAFVGRVDLTPFDGVTVGGSVWAGQSGQNETVTVTNSSIAFGLPEDQEVRVRDTQTTIWEVHAQIQRGGAKFRGLYTQAFVDGAGSLSRTLLGFDDTGAAVTTGAVASRMEGGYAEVGYNLLHFCDTEMSFEPFYRFSVLDTQDRVPNGFARNAARSRTIHEVGFSFKPHPQVVIKLDYRNFSSDAGNGSIADEVQAGIGFVF